MEYNSRYRLGLWTIIVLVVLNIGSIGLLWYERTDQRPEQPLRGDRPTPEDFLAREVGMDDEQVATFRELRKEHFRETDPIKAEIHRLGRQMMGELFATTPDTARVRQLSLELGEKQAEFELGVYRHFEDVKSICQPDQQEQLKGLILDALRSKFPPPMEDGPRGERRKPRDRQAPGLRDNNRPPPPPEGHRPPRRDGNRPRQQDSTPPPPPRGGP